MVLTMQNASTIEQLAAEYPVGTKVDALDGTEGRVVGHAEYDGEPYVRVHWDGHRLPSPADPWDFWVAGARPVDY